MVTISIQPFNLKKIFLFIAGLICLSSVACFADPTFVAVNSTPYDRQMSRVQPVLSSKLQSHREALSLGLVNEWMGILRAIPYGYDLEWRTPQEVETGTVADCKGKAVALYEKMHAAGAKDVRLVIGKRTSVSRKTHAWLEWSRLGSTYVLDPTINWTACRTAEIGRHNYVPLYAYSGSQKYRASSIQLFAKN
jgi:hypothetical protein